MRKKKFKPYSIWKDVKFSAASRGVPAGKDAAHYVNLLGNGKRVHVSS